MTSKRTNLYRNTSDAEREQIKEQLRKWLDNCGREISQTVTKVSPSGMSRHIKNLIPLADEKGCVSLVCIDWHICKVMEYTALSDYGVYVTGCGMDMGFHIVYNLGSILYPKGDGKTITGRNGDKNPETDGGYLIKQRWV